MSKSNYAEDKINNHIMGKTAFTMPSVWVALFTAAPTDAGGGTEVSGNAYARVATTGSTWNTSASGLITNALAITFPAATGSWGTVGWWATFDASTAGNMLLWAALTTSVSPTTGNTPSFAPGALSHSEN
jgi:hypothetical protein